MRVDLHDGIRSFLFAFNFPHINLPPTSETPRIAYYFVARLIPQLRSGIPVALGSAASSIRSFTTTPDKDGYTSKPARMIFIPYIDPMLEVPLVSRKPSMRKKHSRDLSLKNGKKKSKLPETPSAHTLQLSDYTTSGAPTITSGQSSESKPPNTSHSFPKPKLTLTTADLPSGESYNSTPVIDRPHPSTLSSDLTRTTRITDDENKTLAKLTISLPKSRFLPGDEIALKINLQTSSNVPLPKGIGIRVVERRYLATEVNGPKTNISLLSTTTTAEEDTFLDDDANRADEDTESYRLNPYGKEQLRVLTGKKFLLYPDQATPLKHASSESDKGLDGGQEVEQMMVIRLPPFKEFITELLLPSCALPLGDPRVPGISLDGEDQPPSESVINSKGKAPELPPPSTSSVAPSATTAESHEIEPEELVFRVTHIIQVTIPMGSTHWYSRHSSIASSITSHTHSRSASSARTGSSMSAVLEDLDVTVPVIIGNKNPSQVSGRRTPEVRVSSVGESSATSRATRYESESSVYSTSGTGAGAGPSGSGSRRGTQTTVSSSVTGNTLASGSGVGGASGTGSGSGSAAAAGPSGNRSRSLARSEKSWTGSRVSLGGRSNSGMSGGSGGSTGTDGTRIWKEGERFWTLRDGREGLGWVADHF